MRPQRTRVIEIARIRRSKNVERVPHFSAHQRTLRTMKNVYPLYILAHRCAPCAQWARLCDNEPAIRAARVGPFRAMRSRASDRAFLGAHRDFFGVSVASLAIGGRSKTSEITRARSSVHPSAPLSVKLSAEASGAGRPGLGTSRGLSANAPLHASRRAQSQGMRDRGAQARVCAGRLHRLPWARPGHRTFSAFSRRVFGKPVNVLLCRTAKFVSTKTTLLFRSDVFDR